MCDDYEPRSDYKYDLLKETGELPAYLTRKPIVCERCRKGPHHDGFPPIWSVSEAIDLGWSRTETGVLDEECASEIVSNDYAPGWLRESLDGYEIVDRL